jgi:hypothetical protein
MFDMFAMLVAIQPVDSTVAPTAAAAPQPEKKICRQLQITGSTMKRRECRTRAEWKEIDRRNQEMAERARETM